jgi:hypothetical protein
VLGLFDAAVGGLADRSEFEAEVESWGIEVFGTLERARRQVEALTLGEVPSRAALPPGSVMPLRPSRYIGSREGKG